MQSSAGFRYYCSAGRCLFPAGHLLCGTTELQRDLLDCTNNNALVIPGTVYTKIDFNLKAFVRRLCYSCPSTSCYCSKKQADQTRASSRRCILDLEHAPGNIVRDKREAASEVIIGHERWLLGLCVVTVLGEMKLNRKRLLVIKIAAYCHRCCWWCCTSHCTIIHTHATDKTHLLHVATTASSTTEYIIKMRIYTTESSGRVSSVSGVCGILFVVSKQAVALTYATWLDVKERNTTQRSSTTR